MSSSERTFSMELEIDADADTVWRALTEAEELMRWFPPSADVIPGEGGRIKLSWGEDLTGDCRIQVWEPEKRLKMTWWETPDGDASARNLAVDFLIDASGGQTVLRLVHSGFGSDAAWDNEYDSISRGWNFELRSLRHYLENFRGKARQVAFERLPIDSDPAEAWSALVGKDALFGFRGNVAERRTFDLQLPDGELCVATLMHAFTDRDFAAALDLLDGGLLRLGLETFSGRAELWLWLSSWTLSKDRLQEKLEPWKKLIERKLAN